MESKKVYKKVSIIVTISIIMFIVLVFAFSVNNVIACRMMEKEVIRVAGITIEEARTQITGTITIMTAVSLMVGIIALVILAVIMEILVVDN